MRIDDIGFDARRNYDLVIATSGYESRSSYLCRLGVSGAKKFAIEPGLPITDISRSNRDVYRNAGWIVADVAMVSRASAQSLEDATSSGAALEVLVDISSMPRRTMASLLSIFFRHVDRGLCNITFAYVPGLFAQSSVAAVVSSSLQADPVGAGFAGHLRPSSIPVGLILGLGLEPHRAVGLVELLEPARTWAFVSQSDEPRFLEQALETHESLVGAASDATLLRYDMRSIATTYNSLASLVFSVGIDYRIIIAPSGPKPFALASMLVALSSNEAKPAIWRVGESGAPQGVDVAETGDVVAARVSLALGL